MAIETSRWMWKTTGSLAVEETKRLHKLEAIASKLKRVENVQNRQLQTYLSEEDYAQIEVLRKESLG